DKIYYIPGEIYQPYNFPTNNGSRGFLPKPIRFNEIITEFRSLIEEQKAQELPEEQRQTSQARISEIVKDIREIIQQEIDESEEEKKIVNDRKNICDVIADTQDSFQFCYQPPKGNFPALSDFLWYRNNI